VNPPAPSLPLPDPDWIPDFQAPPASFRPMPLWVWNGEVSPRRITAMLEQIAAQGMGGVFIHPRAGLVTEYLSGRWFALWGVALRECERLGLECHLYDENSFPSGFGGGHVLAGNPTLAAFSLVRRTWRQPFIPEREGAEEPALAAFRVTPGGDYLGPAAREDFALASPERPVTVLDLKAEPAGWWQAGFPYVDLARAETTDAFIASTHERYEARFGKAFGATIRYVFTDEPTLERPHGIPFSRHLLREFRARYGYALEERLALLCFELPGAEALRHDYFRLLNDLFVGNFVRRLHDWCGARGLLFTGHFNEHAWPKPDGTPGNMAALRWMQAPGNDLLGFQFSPSGLGANGLHLLNLKELSSVASQLGRERVMAESCGGGGYGMAPADFKPLEDFLLVHGVNLMVPHFCAETLAGARKYDWPQTLSDHSPWWPLSLPHQQHVARCIVALSRGREVNRVLVLQPDVTAWLRWKLARDLSAPPAGEEGSPLRAEQEALLLALTRAGVDYDLGCEMILEELGEAVGKRLRCGERLYDAVVIPPGCRGVLESTVALLSRYLAGGGRVVSGPQAPSFVNGRPSDALAALRERFADRWMSVAAVAGLAETVAGLVPPRVRIRDGSHADLLWRRGELPDGSALFFFANPWDRPFRGGIELEGRSLRVLDTGSGAMRAFGSAPCGGGQHFDLCLPERGHLLLLASPEAGPGGAKAAAPSWRELALETGPVTALEENLLVLDYCDLETANGCHEGIATARADRLNWKAQGWTRNPWSFSIQFRNAFLNTPGAAGMRVKYRFRIDADDAAMATLRLAIERPHLYEIRLNGTLLETACGQPWFDEAIRCVAIGGIARRGWNEVSLSASRFHPLCEIAPVIVLGRFSLREAERGFDIADPVALQSGDWTRQGYPFYPGRVRYEWGFHLPARARRLRLELADWEGSAAAVRLDGVEHPPLVHAPFSAILRGDFAPGPHHLAIEAAGNLRNRMGPHFHEGLPLPWSWEDAPPSPPPGTAYRFFPTGIRRVRIACDN